MLNIQKFHNFWSGNMMRHLFMRRHMKMDEWYRAVRVLEAGVTPRPMAERLHVSGQSVDILFPNFLLMTYDT